MPTTTFWRREVQYVWSCSAQSFSYSNVKLFVPSGRIRVITQYTRRGGADQIVTCVEMFFSELFGQLHIAVRTLWENESHFKKRPIGDYIICCAMLLILLVCH